MAGPGEEMAAGAGRGRLRASRADREHVIETLKAAFVQGLLGKDEFEARVGQTLTARTYAELATLTACIPAACPAACRRLSSTPYRRIRRWTGPPNAWQARARSFRPPCWRLLSSSKVRDSFG